MITTNGGGGEQGIIVVNASTHSGNWVHWAVTIDNSASRISMYRNGILYGTNTGITLRPNNMEPSTSNYFGRSHYGVDHYIDAKFDEFRLNRSALNVDWIKTEYNNQSAPATFYTVSNEIDAAAYCQALPIQLIHFNVTQTQKDEAKITWKTASEINNEYFTIERSHNGVDWEILKKVNGNGNSSKLINYHFIDYNPLHDVSYYRLKQTDYDKTYTYSHTVPLNLYKGIENSVFQYYPNPANKYITIQLDHTYKNRTELELTFVDIYGVSFNKIISIDSNEAKVDVSSVPSGVYMLIIDGLVNPYKLTIE